MNDAISKKCSCLYLVILLTCYFVPEAAYCDVDNTTGLPIQTTNSLNMTFQKIIDSTKMKNDNAEKARLISYDYVGQRKLLVAELLKVLGAPSTSKLNQGMAAYYLGEFRSAEAADILARNITLNLGLDVTTLYQGLPLICGFTARDALIKIGKPSVPALIRNLAENDDASIRELSLQALYQIEGDKDIVQLRLQKALRAEANQQKQARLHDALNSLSAFK